MARFRRQREAGEEQRATTLELFYDLVFVFAITQISHLLLHDLTWKGLLHAGIALLVVWWAWNYTTWVTNELDPDSFTVRCLLIAIMLATLLLAVAIPEAFGSRALLFAFSYVAIQVGRQFFITFIASEAGSHERGRAGRILAWSSFSGVFWIAGAFASGETRLTFWLVALVIDYAAPLVLYWIPGVRQLDHTAWKIEVSHFAERFQLFMIIALGESVVVTGATTAGLDLTTTRALALVIAFLITAAMWWVYFTYVAAIAARRLELSHERTRVARDAYTYLHAVMVAGVILSAVGDGIVISHPTDDLGPAEIAAVVAGPALYLIGMSLFRLRLVGSLPPKRLLGAAGCAVAGVAGAFAPAVVVSALVLASLAGVIVWEGVAARQRGARGEPSPLEQLEASIREGA